MMTSDGCHAWSTHHQHSTLQRTVKPDMSVMGKLFQHRWCFQGRNHLGKAGEGRCDVQRSLHHKETQEDGSCCLIPTKAFALVSCSTIVMVEK